MKDSLRNWKIHNSWIKTYHRKAVTKASLDCQNSRSHPLFQVQIQFNQLAALEKLLISPKHHQACRRMKMSKGPVNVILFTQIVKLGSKYDNSHWYKKKLTTVTGNRSINSSPWWKIYHMLLQLYQIEIIERETNHPSVPVKKVPSWRREPLCMMLMMRTTRVRHNQRINIMLQ